MVAAMLSHALTAARPRRVGGVCPAVFEPNQGRTRPDGRKLTAPDSPRKGRYLVLAWDAVALESGMSMLDADP